MNKTVNINLGGTFFHIDEDAYQKLTRYFLAIKKSLNNSTGQDEILKDIEMRIAELITAKHTNPNQVITMQELDEVIAVMGQPEDYRLDNDGEEQSAEKQSFTNNNYASKPTKKLYRDREKAMIGGVLAGLSHYFGIDRVWLRLIMLFLLFVVGTGFLLYIILWIVIPEAVTTSEKLEMHGEPITLENIEKKVREGFENVTDTIKNADYQKLTSSANRVGSTLGDIIIAILKIFAKFIGGILLLTGFTALVMLIISAFSLQFTQELHLPFKNFVEISINDNYPMWLLSLMILFAIGIPFFFLALLGLKLIVPSLRSIGSVAKYTLLALWLISVAAWISFGIKQASAFSVEGKITQKQNINYNPKDTLNIKFAYNEMYANDVDENETRFVKDSMKNEIIYNNDIDFKIEETDERTPYFIIEKLANGSTLEEAKDRAKAIKYGFKIEGNKLIFNNYLTTATKNKLRDQEVNIILYLPKGTLFKVDKSVRDFDESDNDYFNLHYSSDNYTYKVGNNKVVCLDCPDEDDDSDEDNNAEFNMNIDEDGVEMSKTSKKDSINSVSLKINGKEIIKTEKTKSGVKLEIDENGVVTKKN